MQKRNNIIIIGNNFPSGGASANYLKNLALSLSTNNNVEVLMPSGYYYGSHINKIRKGNIETIKYQYLCFKQHPNNSFGKIIDNICSLYAPFFYLLFRQNNINYFLSYNVSFFKTISHIITANIFKVKLILILPEFYDKPTKRPLSLLKWQSFYIAITFLAKYADGYITFSTFLESYIKTHGSKNKPLIITPNALDVRRFKSISDNKILNDIITIGYVGTPDAANGILDLLNAFAILIKNNKNLKLLIVGDSTNGSGHLVDIAKQKANNLSIEEYITFTGLVSAEEIPRYLEMTNILVLPRPDLLSASAGFPTKLGEYFAARRPVVATRVGDLPKYLRDEEHLIFANPSDPFDLANSIKKLIDNKELFTRLVQNAYLWMDYNLNYINLSNKLDKFLIQIDNYQC